MIRRAVMIVALFFAVLAFCTVTLRLITGDAVVGAVWVPNAVILAVVLRGAKSLTGRITALGAAALAMQIAAMLGGWSPGHALAFALVNIAEVALAIGFIARTADPMASPRAFAVFVGGAVLAAPIIAGGLMALTAPLVWHKPAILDVVKWMMSGALGMLVIGPCALSMKPTDLRTLKDVRTALLAVGGQLVVLGASVAIFMQFATPPLFLIFPVLIIGALSFRCCGGLLSVLIVATVAIVCTHMGRGPAETAALVRLDPVVTLQVLLAAVVMTALPVTALLRKLGAAATELEARRAQAEDLSEIKTKLLAHVSHEIRSPLSGVTSLAELMRDGVMGELTPHQRDTLNQIANSGAEAETLARDLLDAATIQSGKASVHLTDIDVEDAVETAVTAARFRAKEFGGSVVVVGGYAGDLKVAADRLRLRQILINLIVNGLKYGGRPPLVQIAAFATERGTIRFEVSDNGTGVSAELRETMFRSFDRLGAEKSDIEGAGLGLALSRELALLQNGRLGVDDSDLGGARFWLEIPQWRETEGAAAA